MDQQPPHEDDYADWPSQSRYPEPDLPHNFFWAGQEQFVADDSQTYEDGKGKEGGHFADHDSVDTRPSQSQEAENAIRSGDLGAVAPTDQDSACIGQFRTQDGEATGDNVSTYDGELSPDVDDFSDADSDYREVQSSMAKLKDSFRNPKNAIEDTSSDEGIQREQTKSRVRGRGRPPGRPRSSGKLLERRRGIHRGPRKAAEPTAEIKFRLGKASQAFIDEEYDEAMEIVSDVIRINAETHEAWTLLASIFRELGDIEKTLTALMCAAHLRPKDVSGWLNCAQFALEETGDLRPKFLNAAKLCYQSAIRAGPRTSAEPRRRKATLLRELGLTLSAISEYKYLLKRTPHDTTILRLLAEVYIDRDDVKAAQDLYRESIAFYQRSEGIASQAFGWSDINIYVELYAYTGQYDVAIRELKSLSRWALGRSQESWWDNITDDDREWDADNSRRILIDDFVPDRYPVGLYGEGLPLELRVKLGIYRLRLGQHPDALSHFQWLDPENLSHENKIEDYPDLFRDAADTLHEFGLHQQALTFYVALLKSAENVDAPLYLQIGRCYKDRGFNAQAKESFQKVILLDENNVEARMQLAKLHEDLNEKEQAFIYLSETMKIRKAQRLNEMNTVTAEDSTAISGGLVPAPSKPTLKPKSMVDRAEREREENVRTERLQGQYSVMSLEQGGMRAGQDGPTHIWMEAAKELIEDFRGFKIFYPWDKYVRFLGYTTTAPEQTRTGATPLDADVAAMASRLSHKLGTEIEGEGSTAVQIPENYRGISFTAWLDIFLEYALCLAKLGRYRESYDICEAGRDAIVFYHSREDQFLIHLCWCTCAILANDEQTCVSACRFFTKDHQFTTDSYRMFAALMRLCQSPISWYTSGPTQKYVLRQIKAMDYALVDDECRKKYAGEKISYSVQDKEGQPIINQDMDVALVMLYGHILYAGTSYHFALNYFLRAYALDPENPVINLSIGLSYVHYGLKRQSENRQFHFMQGLSFLFRYYNTRKDSVNIEERQEAHYNIARTYHMLGLGHLALPYYLKVLREVSAGCPITREDLVRDAAYNLQNIYAMSGNIEMAKAVTNDWLLV